MIMRVNSESVFVELEEYIIWEELGISAGTAIIVLIAIYFVVKWAVRRCPETASLGMNKE